MSVFSAFSDHQIAEETNLVQFFSVSFLPFLWHTDGSFCFEEIESPVYYKKLSKKEKVL